MRVMIILFALLSGLLVCSSLVSAIDVDFSCPDAVSVDEEFECSLIAQDFEAGDGAWDVKVELMEGNTRLAEIFDEDLNEWKSAYYYLYGVIDEVGKEYVIQLKIVKDFAGDVVGVLKLRKGSSRDFFEFDISVGDSGGSGNSGVDEEGEEEDDEDEEGEEVVALNSEVIEGTEETKPASVISLNSVKDAGDDKDDNLDGEVIYESKNERVRKYAIYGFALFLIFVLGVVLWRG